MAGGYFTLRKGVYVGDEFYYKNQNRYAQDESNYIERLSRNDYKIVSDTGDKEVSLHLDENVVTFNFSDGVSFTGIWNGRDCLDSDGFPLDLKLESEYGPSIVVGDIEHSQYSQPLCNIYFEKYETIWAWYMNVFGLIFYVLEIIQILYPDESHFFLSRWRYNHTELSDDGRLVEQLGGVILAVCGIGIMSGLIFILIR